MKRIFMALVITLSLPLFASAAEEGAAGVVDAILKTMGIDEIQKDDRGSMPSKYEYSFIDECRFKVHSEWYGRTHFTIDNEVIELGKVKIEELQEDGKFYLLFKCLEGKRCISVKGENTGEKLDYMRTESIVPAGSSPEIFDRLKGYFERLSSGCVKGSSLR